MIPKDNIQYGIQPGPEKTGKGTGKGVRLLSPFFIVGVDRIQHGARVTMEQLKGAVLSRTTPLCSTSAVSCYCGKNFQCFEIGLLFLGLRLAAALWSPLVKGGGVEKP